jgi:putative oxidoreductase
MIRFLNRMQPWALTLIRIVLGVSMLVHGWEKLIPPGGLHRAHPFAGVEYFNRFVVSLGLPYWLGYVSVATEFLGGILLLLGLLTRFVGLLVAINMLVALVQVNRHHGYSGSEYTLALIAMATMLLAAGSGTLSLDRRFGIS